MVLQYFREILFLLGNDKRKIPFMILLYFFSSIMDILGIGIIIPFISIFNVDNISSNKFYIFLSKYYNIESTNQAIILLGSILLLTFTLKTLLSITINKINIKFSTNQDIKIRLMLMDIYQNMSYLNFTTHNNSDLIQRIRNHVGEYVYNCLIPLFRLISESLVCVLVLILLIFISPFAILLLIVLLSIFFISYNFFIKKEIVKAGQASVKYATRLTIAIQESLNGFKEIRVLEIEKYFRNIVEISTSKNAKAQNKYLTLTFMPRYLLELTIITFMVSFPLILIISNKSIDNVFSILTFFGIAAMRIIPSSNIIFQSITTLRFIRPSVKKVYEDVFNYSNFNNTQNLTQNKLNNSFESFEAKNISFKYPNNKICALKNVSFKFYKGETIGIIGTSGAGKTTLIDIILGLITVESGTILVNNQNIEKIQNHLNKNFAYLPQEIFLIDDTLKKNIALGVENIDDEKVLSAIKAASLYEFYLTLKDGLDTNIGDNGNKISGGQRQRIALARAIYHDREVLVMDESTSALDTKTEMEVVNNINLLKNKKTMIIIAHRMTSLNHCDRIYELKNGELSLYTKL